MAVNNIDSVFDEMKKDCQSMMVSAVKKAAKRAQEDVMKEANKYLAQYYANYSPKQYKRQGKLRRAIMPYWADRSSGGNISITIGVRYNAGALKGAYRSNSRFHQSGDVWRSVSPTSDYRFSVPSLEKIGSDNGIPEPGWILDNYLEGVHPWGQTDDESTDSMMKKFIEQELPDRISGYIYDELFGLILSRL